MKKVWNAIKWFWYTEFVLWYRHKKAGTKYERPLKPNSIERDSAGNEYDADGNLTTSLVGLEFWFIVLFILLPMFIRVTYITFFI
jgi:hypothetical protein